MRLYSADNSCYFPEGFGARKRERATRKHHVTTELISLEDSGMFLAQRQDSRNIATSPFSADMSCQLWGPMRRRLAQKDEKWAMLLHINSELSKWPCSATTLLIQGTFCYHAIVTFLPNTWLVFAADNFVTLGMLYYLAFVPFYLIPLSANTSLIIGMLCYLALIPVYLITFFFWCFLDSRKAELFPTFAFLPDYLSADTLVISGRLWHRKMRNEKWYSAKFRCVGFFWKLSGSWRLYTHHAEELALAVLCLSRSHAADQNAAI